MKPSFYDTHGRLQILAVDDDSVNLMVIESVLRPLGWDIVLAMDGTEAYAAVAEGDTWPDLVLLDYNLDVGDSGETVLARLRDTFGDAVPIIMCTAMSANSVELDRCLDAGAVDVLLKPYDRNRVVDMVGKYCPGKAHPRPAPAPARA
ncbi:Transcriptional regulatory protein ZraR, partial [Tetrabaena socialis]